MASWKDDWLEYEQSIAQLLSCLSSHSEFEVIDGSQLKSFMAENLVLNYSNIELHRVVLQNKSEGVIGSTKHFSSKKTVTSNQAQRQGFNLLNTNSGTV